MYQELMVQGFYAIWWRQWSDLNNQRERYQLVDNKNSWRNSDQGYAHHETICCCLRMGIVSEFYSLGISVKNVLPLHIVWDMDTLKKLYFIFSMSLPRNNHLLENYPIIPNYKIGFQSLLQWYSTIFFSKLSYPT